MPLQPSIDAASNSRGSTERTPKMVLTQDRIERAEEHQKERRARPEPEDDHRQRQPRRDRNRPQHLEGRIEQLPDQRHAPDQHAERQRDDQRQREAAIDAADRGQQMDVQGLAEGVVIDAAEGEIPEFEPDFVRRRDQAARPPDRGEMPERQHRRGKRDRQQQRPQARPPGRRP